jgi:hypothetical protein
VTKKAASFGRLTRLALILAVGIAALPCVRSQAASVNDVFAAIAMRVPAFAGVHVDEQQELLYVHLRNGPPQIEQAVLAELKIYFSNQKWQRYKVQVLPAAFSFTQLKQWHDRMAMRVLQHPGVTFIGIDHANNRVVIGVKDSNERASVEPQLATLSHPREAVDFMETGPLKLQGPFPGLELLDARRRPLVGGQGIGVPGGTCTIGFIAKRKGALGFVTASHCSSRQGAADKSDEYYQGGDFVGLEETDPSFFGCNCLILGRYLCRNHCRFSDSTFVKLDPSRGTDVSADLGLIADAGFLFPIWDQMSTNRIETAGDPLIGHVVATVGRTSGWEPGVVFLTGVTVNISLLNALIPRTLNPPFTRLLLNQVLAYNNSFKGDSGGPVTDEKGSTLEGINWGSFVGLSLFSPISGVLADLGDLEFVAPPALPPKKPDLVAQSQPGSTRFCTVVGNQPRVVVRVSNRGDAPAGHSTTRVDFPPLNHFDIATPPVGNSADRSLDLLPIEPPAGCFQPDCNFVITVDINNDVDEGSAGEANNMVLGSCPGPGQAEVVTITSAKINSVNNPLPRDRIRFLEVIATDNIPGVDLFVTVQGCTGADRKKMTPHPDEGTYSYNQLINTCRGPTIGHIATVSNLNETASASAEIQNCDINSGQCSGE